MQYVDNLNITQNTTITDKEFEFEKDRYAILDGSLDYYSKSKSKKYRGYKYRTMPTNRSY